MLKQVTVNVIVDDHEPERCGNRCIYVVEIDYPICVLFDETITYKQKRQPLRCKQCLEEAK